MQTDTLPLVKTNGTQKASQQTMDSESRSAKQTHDARSFSYQRVDEYRKQFVDPATGLVCADRCITRCCPVCGSNQAFEMFVKAGGRYVRCEDCSMVHLNPILNPVELERYYQNLNTGQAEITANESGFYREIYQLGLSRISPFSQPGNLLDVGCSSGFFLDVAKEQGWSTAGLELCVSEAEIAQRKGHDVGTEPIQVSKFDKKFDLITMWDVFEHIPDGREFLEVFKTHLAPQGIVLMQIPNSGGLAPRIMQEHCRMFDGLEHVNLYNPATIRQLAESCGYQVLSIHSVISEIAVTNNYTNYDLPYSPRLDSRETKFAGILDADQLHQNLLGYKLQVALRFA